MLPRQKQDYITSTISLFTATPSCEDLLLPSMLYSPKCFVFEDKGLGWPGDSQRESGIRANRLAEQENNFHNVRAIRANRLKPAIRNVLVPRNAIRKKGGSVQESANRFARIGPSKTFGSVCPLEFVPLGFSPCACHLKSMS